MRVGLTSVGLRVGEDVGVELGSTCGVDVSDGLGVTEAVGVGGSVGVRVGVSSVGVYVVVGVRVSVGSSVGAGSAAAAVAVGSSLAADAAWLACVGVRVGRSVSANGRGTNKLEVKEVGVSVGSSLTIGAGGSTGSRAYVSLKKMAVHPSTPVPANPTMASLGVRALSSATERITSDTLRRPICPLNVSSLSATSC